MFEELLRLFAKKKPNFCCDCRYMYKSCGYPLCSMAKKTGAVFCYNVRRHLNGYCKYYKEKK